MSLLSQLLDSDTPANSANHANQAPTTAPTPPAISNISKISNGPDGKNDTAARLLALAKAKGLPASLVHKLTADDLAECEAEPDRVLTAYLLALECTAVREAGQIPDGYDKKAYCKGCGWVWLFTRGTVDGCPWCWNRSRSLPIPRPAVRCIDCEHFTRIEHPHLGHCAKGQPENPAGLWDTDTRVCAAFQPRRDTGNNEPTEA